MSKQIRKSFVFALGGHEFRIDNYFNSYHYGFSHTSKVFMDGFFQAEAVVGYINRTWECYDYQTSAKRAVCNWIDAIKASKKEEYKNLHGLQRMTKRHNENFAAELENDSFLQLLRQVYDLLKNWTGWNINKPFEEVYYA